MLKFYIDNNGDVQSIEINELREKLNCLYGCPMPSGVAPKYEMGERVMYACHKKYGDYHYESDRFNSEEDAQEWLEEQDAEENPTVSKVTEYFVGYNSFGKFNERDKFDTKAEAIEWLNSACDYLILNTDEFYYDSQEEAQAFLDELSEA